ncbi:hypothetical protein PGB90_002921 [Kerria lacca]
MMRLEDTVTKKIGFKRQNIHKKKKKKKKSVFTNFVSTNVNKSTIRIKSEDVLSKSVIGPGFEKLFSVPLNHKSTKILKRERKLERMKTKGDNWFNFSSMEITPEIHKDLEVLQMRSALDPKRFYKKNDMKKIPKFFQIGRVVDSPIDFYSSRIPKRKRKRTIVEELMIDEEFKTYTKRKYNEILKSDPRRRKKAQRKAKKLKKMKH